MLAKADNTDNSVDCVIVTYNNESTIVDCLDSLKQQTGVTINTTVVDNVSSDGTVEIISGVDAEVISNSTNVGFAAGINQASQHGKSPWILIFNPDAYFTSDDAVKLLLDRRRQYSDVAIVGPKLSNTDGTPYPNGRAFPTLGIGVKHALMTLTRSGEGNPDYLNPSDGSKLVDSESHVADWISGCCMLVSRKDFEAVGGFDERYYMYVEDMDLCWRITADGKRVIIADDVDLIHVGGVSTSSRKLRNSYYHHVSMAKFIFRRERGIKKILIIPFGLGLACRWVAVVLRAAVLR